MSGGFWTPVKLLSLLSGPALAWKASLLQLLQRGRGHPQGRGSPQICKIQAPHCKPWQPPAWRGAAGGPYPSHSSPGCPGAAACRAGCAVHSWRPLSSPGQRHPPCTCKGRDTPEWWQGLCTPSAAVRFVPPPTCSHAPMAVAPPPHTGPWASVWR